MKETDITKQEIADLEAQLEAKKDELAQEEMEYKAQLEAEREAKQKEEEEALALQKKEEEEAKQAALLKEKERKEKLQLRIDNIKNKTIIYNGFTSVTAHSNPDSYLATILNMAPTTAGKVLKKLEELDIQRSKDIVIENRKKEYKSIEEVVHIILDHGINSQEMIALQEERAAIKAKYPKVVV